MECIAKFEIFHIETQPTSYRTDHFRRAYLPDTIKVCPFCYDFLRF
jgi:hypothetical protein